MPKNKANILLVDGEDAARHVLSTQLSHEGFTVTLAAEANAAIQELTAKPFDLVLTEIVLPQGDGFEVLRFATARRPSTKVVVLTGYADLKNAIESKKQGAADFVAKPYDLVDLVCTIERVLGEP